MPTPKFADSELASGTCDVWALGEGSPGCCEGYSQLTAYRKGLVVRGIGGTHLALQGPDEEGLKEFPGLVAVTDVLEGLRGILTPDVEQDLLATTVTFQCQPASPRAHGKGARRTTGLNLRVLVNELADVVDFVVNDHVQVILGVVLRNVRESEFGRHLVGVCWGGKPRWEGSRIRDSDKRDEAKSGDRSHVVGELFAMGAGDREAERRSRGKVWTGSWELCKSRTARVEPVPCPERLVSKLTPAQVRG